MTKLSLHHPPLPAETFLSEMSVFVSAYFIGSHGQNTREATSPLVQYQKLLPGQHRLHPLLIRHPRSVNMIQSPRGVVTLRHLSYTCHDSLCDYALNDFVHQRCNEFSFTTSFLFSEYCCTDILYDCKYTINFVYVACNQNRTPTFHDTTQ